MGNLNRNNKQRLITMKGIGTSTLVFFMIFLINSSSFAVDGYREFKWDMSVNEIKKIIKKQNFCRLKDSGTDSQGIHTFFCEDFPFGEHKRQGFFLFIEDRLLRIGIALRKEEIEPLIMILNKQYKKADTSEMSKKERVEAGTFGWDNDTILLKVHKPYLEEQKRTKRPEYENSNIGGILIYTSENFESILKSVDTKSRVRVDWQPKCSIYE